MLLIQNGILHTMESDDPIRADLLTRDGKIVKIARRIPLGKGMRAVDAEGLHVYPGFIDAHSHIGIAEEQTTAQTDCNFVLLAAARWYCMAQSLSAGEGMRSLSNMV